MNTEQISKIEALKYAIYICDSRKSHLKVPVYNVACDDIKLCLEAAMSRVETGDDLESYAYTQENILNLSNKVKEYVV